MNDIRDIREDEGETSAGALGIRTPKLLRSHDTEVQCHVCSSDVLLVRNDVHSILSADGLMQLYYGL